MTRALFDAGPLVAILNKTGHRHVICRETLAEIATPFYSCWPVLTEAAWLLGGRPHLVRNLLGMITPSELQLLPIADDEVPAIHRILERYSNLRPQLADAALVYLAERENIDTIFTLDRRDFSVYRTSRNRPFRILPELPH